MPAPLRIVSSLRPPAVRCWRSRASPFGSAALSRSTGSVRRGAGRNLRADRPERRRQDHAVQLSEPALTPAEGTITLRGAAVAADAGAPDRRARHRPDVPESRAVSLHVGAPQHHGRRALPHRARIFSPMRCGCRRCGGEERGLHDRVDGTDRCVSGLRSVADRAVAELPFGTQKRVELARALAARPKLLLLDEPAGGLNHDEVDAAARADSWRSATGST